MRPFNLAQTKILERSYCRQHFEIRLRGITLLVALMVVAAVGSGSFRAAIRSKASCVRSEVAVAEARRGETRRELANTEMLSLQYRWQNELAQRSKRWIKALDSILQRAPKDVWLNRIQSAGQGGGVSVEGAAGSYESLSAFAGRLRGCPMFSDVRLCSTKMAAAGSGGAIEFTVQLHLRSASSAPSIGAQTSDVPNIGGQF